MKVHPPRPDHRRADRGRAPGAGAASDSPPPQADGAAVAAILQRPERAHGHKSLALQLAFDSVVWPAPAGRRSTAASGERHLIYLSSDFSVDLQMETLPDRPAVLYGELVSRRWGPLAEVPAFLIDGDRIAGYDCTGELGEFQFEAAHGRELRLCLLLDAERCIDLALDAWRNGEAA